jgi:hypothetical protein
LVGGLLTDRTTLGGVQLMVYFILSWIPLAGWAALSLVATATGIAQANNIWPILYQGVIYIALAVLIWRRSLVALTVATLLFLADSCVYTYEVFRLFPLATGNPYDMSHWPLGLIVPIVVRITLCWFLLTSFGAMRSIRLHNRRLKTARNHEHSKFSDPTYR